MKYILPVLTMVCLGITSYAQANKLDKLKWLQGQWVMNTGGLQFVEQWTAVDNMLWIGIGYGLNKKGDTTFKEDLQIALQGDTVWYLPTIANQNEGKEVRFAAIELSEKKAVFENKQHDFPQRIVYNKTSDSTVYAYVEGMQKGKIQKEEFHFKRK
ncbi:MAG: hypothetical protein EOP51_09035 [Sphingobacteriales bacterium]|nr:MAG: hypothetical protein EOP51_09035 [Sphingobacteriales bacterium]